MALKHLDLFSGIGGFALAASWAGIETVQFVEIDSFCQKVLAKNFPNVPIHDDIKTFNCTKRIDLLTGGFPCQPFSCAGKRKGFQDDRYLWPEMFRVIRECKPNWIIAENVPGIISNLDPILLDLENERYAWRAFLIPASAVHAPHKRERLWIIANRDSERCDNGGDTWQKRYLQNDWERYIEALQSEWTQFQPESWKAFNIKEWLGFTSDTISREGQRQHQIISKENTGKRLISWRETCRNESFTNTNDNQCNQRTENNETITKRLERSKPAATVGNASSNTNRVAGEQTDTETITQRESGQAWGIDRCKYRQDESIFNWEKDKPPIPGVDDGVSHGLDRNKSLGNAIVPQIAYLLIMLIKYFEKSKNENNKN